VASPDQVGDARALYARPEMSCDVAIVGGGGMGSATAYFLRSFGGSALNIVVFEPDPTYARASTALAAGGIRQQFSTPENILMSQFGYRFLETIGETLATDDERPTVNLTPRPYLRLVSEERLEVLARDLDVQRKSGAGSEWLTASQIAARYPWMETSDIGAAILGGDGEGMFDPYSMLQAFRRRGRSLGVRYHSDRVVGMEIEGANVTSLQLATGERVRCGAVVNAAGPRAAEVAAMAGLELPVDAVKAHSFAFSAERPVSNCPIILDQIQGLQLKPEGQLFVCGAPGGEPATDADDFAPDPELFEAVVWPRLARRVPQFETLRLKRAWVGHVEYNRLDGNPVLGLHPDRPNLYFITGFSGHGAQHVPAAGRALAELIIYGEYRSIDLSRFGYERVLGNAPVREGV